MTHFDKIRSKDYWNLTRKRFMRNMILQLNQNMFPTYFKNVYIVDSISNFAVARPNNGPLILQRIQPI